VAAEVGGTAWVPFLVAFLIATITAFSYLELVTKYPQAAGAALYAHKAFGVQFVLLFFVTMVINRRLGVRGAGITDPTHLGSAPD